MFKEKLFMSKNAMDRLLKYQPAIQDELKSFVVEITYNKEKEDVGE